MSSIVFTFLRANPPTQGHEKLVQKVIGIAKQNGADHAVYLSQTHKAQTDPLDWHYKRRIAQTIFSGVNISSDKAMISPFHVLENLAKNYDKVIFIVGDDRLEEFTRKMTPYAEQWSIKDFNVISAGERDPDANDVRGVSATRARQFAEQGDYDSFARMLSNKLSANVKRDIYNKIRVSFGLEEDADNKNADEYRRKGLKGIFAYSGWG
jgi:hypothetical protein